MAHLGFEDYLGSAVDAQRREWRKIHGRFEDIPFVANTAHSVALLAEALNFTGTAARKRAVASEAKAARVAVEKAAGVAAPRSLKESLAATYPLHPAVAIALPALAAQLGQHDRSLVAYLTSDAPHALTTFLEPTSIDAKQVPFVRLS